MKTYLAQLISFLSQRQASRDESYLALASDLPDLERRMRHLENGHLDPQRNPIYSFG